MHYKWLSNKNYGARNAYRSKASSRKKDKYNTINASLY